MDYKKNMASQNKLQQDCLNRKSMAGCLWSVFRYNITKLINICIKIIYKYIFEFDIIPEKKFDEIMSMCNVYYYYDVVRLEN